MTFSFLFPYLSKLKDSEKKNLELLSEIEQLIKDTEELRSEKGMGMCLHPSGCNVMNTFYYKRIGQCVGRRIVHMLEYTVHMHIW